MTAPKIFEWTPDEYNAEILEARAMLSRSTAALCGWRRCTILIDPVDGKAHPLFGDPLCGCDNLPGWDSPYPAGQPKPQAPVKARGRHGSRIQRSTARRVEWRRMCAEFGIEDRR